MPDEHTGSEQFTDEDRAVLRIALPGRRRRAVRESVSNGVGSRRRTAAAGSGTDDHERVRRSACARQVFPFRGRVRTDARLRRRPAMGTGSEGVRALPSSSRRLPCGPLADHRRHAVFRLFPSSGSTALVVARYSSGAGGNRRGRIRSLALVGKLFPTMDPDHPSRYEPRTSSRRRTSVGSEAIRSTPPSCETRPT